MSDRNIRVDLCPDHFRRLVNDDTCANCPSRAENEAVVRAMSAVLETDTDQTQRAIVSELQQIRTAQSRTVDKLNTLQADTQGLTTRITVIESRFDSSNRSMPMMVAVGAAALSAAVALFGIIMNLVAS